MRRARRGRRQATCWARTRRAGDDAYNTDVRVLRARARPAPRSDEPGLGVRQKIVADWVGERASRLELRSFAVTDDPTVDELNRRSNRLRAPIRATRTPAATPRRRAPQQPRSPVRRWSWVLVKGSGASGHADPRRAPPCTGCARWWSVYPGVEREDEMVAAFDFCLHGGQGRGGTMRSTRRCTGWSRRRTSTTCTPDWGSRWPPRPTAGGSSPSMFAATAWCGCRGGVPASSWAWTRGGGGGEPAGHRRGVGRPRDHRRGARDQRGGAGALVGDHRRGAGVPGRARRGGTVGPVAGGRRATARS